MEGCINDFFRKADPEIIESLHIPINNLGVS